ncbi:MAG: hypothetical protein L0177_19125, partial [Chloroflexi bacterium]|nr:hypothetical protein [Chloroflexota bacterium]
MIKSKQEYEVTKVELKKFNDEIEKISSRPDEDDLYKKTMLDGLRVWQKRLEAEIKEYESAHLNHSHR